MKIHAPQPKSSWKSSSLGRSPSSNRSSTTSTSLSPAPALASESPHVDSEKKPTHQESWGSITKNVTAGMPPQRHEGTAEQSVIQCMASDSNTQTSSTTAPSGDRGQSQSTSSNQTGIPDTLKSNMESMSGYDLSDVRVHYRSQRPQQMGALAYTQGSNIYIGPGQEKHLPHEAWHVVQQKQGRVQETVQTKGISLNDETALEQEATVMGEQALHMHSRSKAPSTIQHQDIHTPIIQRKMGFELQTVGGKNNIHWDVTKQQAKGVWTMPPEKTLVTKSSNFKVETDNNGQDLEYISNAFETTEKGANELVNVAKDCAEFHKKIIESDEDTILIEGENRFKLFKDGQASAHPHLTVGLSFESLRTLYASLASEKEHWGGSSSTVSYQETAKEKERNAFKIAGKKVKSVMSDLKITDPAADAFLTIAATFVWFTSARLGVKGLVGQQKSSKDVAVKLRTDAVSIWNSITNKEDKHKIEALFGKTEQQDTQNLKKLLGYSGGRHSKMISAYTQLTVGEWFDGVMAGKDPLSKHNMSEINPDRPKELEKYGMKSPTDTGLSGPGQVVELRALKRRVNYTDWESYIKSVVDLVPKVEPLSTPEFDPLGSKAELPPMLDLESQTSYDHLRGISPEPNFSSKEVDEIVNSKI